MMWRTIVCLRRSARCFGLGRAAGTDPMTTHALQRDRSRAMPDDFPQQLAELLDYYEDTIPVSSPLGRLVLAAPPRQ